MGRSPCCDKEGLKKGPWTPEEDQKLLAYIHQFGHGSWRVLPTKAGLQRCGKSCRLRWNNYLRPDIKRGKFSMQEEQTIIQLHALLGNRWSAIAAHLPKRTDNEIKNYWNTHLKKRLCKMGIDPMTHKPKMNNPFGSHLSHMAQWETARLEAEARLVRRRFNNYTTTSSLLSSALSPHFHLNKPPGNPPSPPKVPPSLDVLKAWQEAWTKPPPPPPRTARNHKASYNAVNDYDNMFVNQPPTTYAAPNFSADQDLLAFPTVGSGDDNTCYVENPHVTLGNGYSGPVMDPLSGLPTFIQGFTELLPENLSAHYSTGCSDENYVAGNCGAADMEDNKSYWNSILNLVAPSPVSSPVF